MAPISPDSSQQYDPDPFPTLVLPGESLEFAGGFSDPGVLDTHEFLWQFGDQASDPSLNTKHGYSCPGSYLVSFMVTDDDGGSDTAQDTVVVDDGSNAAAIMYNYVDGLSVSFFQNPARKQQLLGLVSLVGSYVQSGDLTSALFALNVIRITVDGVQPPPDWIWFAAARLVVLDMDVTLAVALQTRVTNGC